MKRERLDLKEFYTKCMGNAFNNVMAPGMGFEPMSSRGAPVVSDIVQDWRRCPDLATPAQSD